MPLGEDVLVEGAEVSGVGSDRGGAVAPDRSLAGSKGGVSDAGRGPTTGVGVHVAAARIPQVVLAVAVFALGDPPEAGVRPVGVDGQQEPLLEDVAVENLPGADRGELGGEADP
jgi:hypothetical protein